MYSELKNYIDSLPIFDTHEHLINCKYKKAQFCDVVSLMLSHYLTTDVIASGLTLDELDFLRGEGDLQKKWSLLLPYLKDCQHGAYFQALQIAFKDLYNADLLTCDIAALNEQVLERFTPAWTQEVITERCHIQNVVNDTTPLDMQHRDMQMDIPAYLTSPRLDNYILVQDYFDELEKWHGKKIQTLSDITEMIKTYITEHVKSGCVAFKIGSAYIRTLSFLPTSRETAETILGKLLTARASGQTLSRTEIKPLEDYLCYICVENAAKSNRPIQIHTGIIEDSYTNFLNNSHPLNLAPMIAAFPNARFDLLHFGYPFARESFTLAKTYPHVYLDMAWVHILSRTFAVEMLTEAIEMLPTSKIFGFGGDFKFVEGSYGHLQLAKRNITAALSKMMQDNVISLENAYDIAEKILYSNPKKFFTPQH